MTEAAPIFSASEIGDAIGWTKWRVQTALKGHQSNGSKKISGNQCAAWAIARLPKTIGLELQRIREVHRYRSVESVLRDPAREWTPETPNGQIDESAWTKAKQLREALGTAMAMPEETSTRDRTRAAAPHYMRAFGCGISDRQLRRLITRTLDRDRGAKNFARLEIYLHESPRLKGCRANIQRTAGIDFQDLKEDFSAIADPTKPTVEERAFCWRKIVESYELQIELGVGEVPLKKALKAFVLDSLPFIAESGNAFKRNLNRKLSLAATGGASAIMDGRKNSGRRRKLANWQEDIMRLAKAARAYGSRIGQAYRELMTGTHPSGERFSEEFMEHYSFDGRRSKSDVPAAVAAAVRPMMAATEGMAHGPKAARLAAPSMRRDWTMLPAGASFTADDVTFNHYIYDWCDEGKYEFGGRRFNVTRGQTLVFCDERTGFVLGFSFCPRPQYTADDICAAIAQLCMDRRIGLPTKRFLFERSIWKGKKVKGLISWAKREEGFLKEEITLGMAHATTPKAKIVERVLGALQSMMQALPCYIGRNERLDNFEREEAFIASLKEYGQPLKEEVNPAARMLSKDRMAGEIENVMRRFNAEPQNGERLPGISPEEGWKQFRSPAPSKVLPEALRYLLSTHETSVTVTTEGIMLRIGRMKHFYSGSARLGELIGEKVLVRFNPEMPDMVTVTHPASDPKQERPFSVEIDSKIPAIGATATDFEKAKSSRKAFTAFGKSIFRAIAPANHLTIQDNRIATPEALKRGERIGELAAEHAGLESKRSRRAGGIRQLAALNGVAIDPARARRPDAVEEDLRRASELEAEIERQEAQEA